MKESFELVYNFSTTPEKLYKAWLDSETHSEMTGGEAECSDIIGDSFYAWDEYITGENLELIPNQKIVQTCRTTEFEDHNEDSIIKIEFKQIGNKTELTLKHENLPEGQTQYIQGWKDHYFSPMNEFFSI